MIQTSKIYHSFCRRWKIPKQLLVHPLQFDWNDHHSSPNHHKMHHNKNPVKAFSQLVRNWVLRYNIEDHDKCRYIWKAQNKIAIVKRTFYNIIYKTSCPNTVLKQKIQGRLNGVFNYHYLSQQLRKNNFQSFKFAYICSWSTKKYLDCTRKKYQRRTLKT